MKIYRKLFWTLIHGFAMLPTIAVRGLMEDTRRKSTSVQQLDCLITFMEAHTNFAVGQLRSKEGRVLATRMWHRCADILNSEGVARTPKDWSRFWNDYKCRVRTKLAEINRGYRGTGGGPSRAPQLSPLEERVAALLGRDVGPLTGVRQDPEIEIELVNAEEIEVQQDVELTATNSPVLDLSIIAESTEAPANGSPATQDLSRTVTLESQQRDSAHHVEENNQPADHGSTLPQTGRPRHRQPRPTRSGPTARAGGRPRFVHQSNTAALDESRATIARIEEMRARTEEMVATAALNMTNSMTSFSTAMISISNAMSGIANAMTSMAESLRTYVSPSDS